MYSISLGGRSESDEVRKWIGDHWNANHIFAVEKSVFLWQHFNQQENQLHFVFARHKRSGEIHSLLGFIPTWQYDPSLRTNPEIFLALWMTDEKKAQQKGLGLQLLDYIHNQYQPQTTGVLGITQDIKILYKYLKYTLGTLNHYYIPNRSQIQYTLASLHPRPQSTLPQTQTAWLENLHNLPNLDSNTHPRKTREYFINRYAKHPVYKYRFLGLTSADHGLSAILVIRKAAAEGARCLRIIDVYGNLENIQNLDLPLQRILTDEDCEYIDCYNFGLSESIFYQMGFQQKTSEEILPNFFEPFEKANRDIDFAFTSQHKNICFFKGDGDQDRPNQIPGLV